jgi:hypothetical protein
VPARAGEGKGEKLSGCGCGSSAQAGAAETWRVTPADGTSVKTFSTKPEADVYAARTGGIVRKLS